MSNALTARLLLAMAQELCDQESRIAALERHTQTETQDSQPLLSANPSLLTPDQARELLGVGRGTMYRLLKEGRITHIRMGSSRNSSIRIPIEAIQRFRDSTR